MAHADGSNDLMHELLEKYEQAVLTASQGKSTSRVSEATLLAFFEMNPMPAWIKAVRKDGTLCMIRVNRAYETEVGIPDKEYRGETDHAVQEPDSADEYSANDLAAIERGEVLYVLEHDTDRVTGLPREWKVWKWPVQYEDTVVAVCGVALGQGHGRG